MNDTDNDPFRERKLRKLQHMIFLIPLVGWIPALWTVSRRQESSQALSVSRDSIKLTVVWAVAYSLLWLSSLQASEVLTLRLLYLNGLLTSGNILISLGLMFRVWQRKN
ncbi:MAG: hypothetical protein AAGF26_10720 [Cyanobacteria bacterium P01_G01_bin.49]